jgi:hypothetical protein
MALLEAKVTELETEVGAIKASNLRNGGAPITGVEGPKRTLKAYAVAASENGRLGFGASGFLGRAAKAHEMARLYAEIKARWAEFADMPLSECGLPIRAADNTDANLGTLAGTLVAQRSLELFQYEFGGMIGRVTTDFSDEPGEYGQTMTTRIITAPATQLYDATLTADGTPKGWKSVTPPQTTDVPITLDAHLGVPIRFDSNMLASTARRLFDEQAPMASYALAKYFVEKIYALFTPANYNGYNPATTTAKVPVKYPSFVVAVGDFGRSALVKLDAIFTQNEVPIANRSVLVNPAYHAQLASDPSLVTFYAGQRAPEIMTDNDLPKLGTFMPLQAPNLTANNATPNLVGMALHRAGVVAKTRLPTDYTAVLPGANYGSVTTVKNPNINISCMLVQYADHAAGFAEWRLQVLLGAAKGDKRGGLCILSQ